MFMQLSAFRFKLFDDRQRSLLITKKRSIMSMRKQTVSLEMFTKSLTETFVAVYAWIVYYCIFIVFQSRLDY